MTERKWLSVCAAFALGEAVASLGPNFAEAWPVCAFAAVLLAVWGTAVGSSCCRFLCVVALGIGVYLFSELEQEREFRDRPWMRQVHAKSRRAEPGSCPLARRFRRELSRRMGVGLDHAPDIADMNRAILLGERRGINPETRRDFVRSGTVHVFAISGLHVMVIANAFIVMAAFAAVPFRLRALAAAPALWGYVWLIGFPPSAVRAALMASIHFSAPLFWRRPNAAVSWAIAFMILHIRSPRLISDIGCQLSFAVMLAIVLAARRARGLPEIRQRMAVAFSAWAAGVPIVAHAFGSFTPGGLAANLALVPAASVAVVSCVAGLALSWAGDTVLSHANNFAALVTSSMAHISGMVARCPGANFEISRWGIAECALWYAVFLSVPYVIRRILSKRLF